MICTIANIMRGPPGRLILPFDSTADMNDERRRSFQIFPPSRKFKTTGSTQKSSNVLSLRRATLHQVAHNRILLSCQAQAPGTSDGSTFVEPSSTKLWATAAVPGKPGFCLRAHALLLCRFPRLMEIGRQFSPGFPENIS
jgi:hypothetical protein